MTIKWVESSGKSSHLRLYFRKDGSKDLGFCAPIEWYQESVCDSQLIQDALGKYAPIVRQ